MSEYLHIYPFYIDLIGLYVNLPLSPLKLKL